MRWRLPVFLIILLCGSWAVPTVGARGMKNAGIPWLCEHSAVVAAGQVVRVKRSGIETTLSYPTVRDEVFIWLEVMVRLEAVYKPGQSQADAGDTLPVAMMAMADPNSGGFFNGPLLLEPEVGDKFLLFLAPSPYEKLYVSMFAPYDEANAVFILEPDHFKYKIPDEIPDNDAAREYWKEQRGIKGAVEMLVDKQKRWKPEGLKAFAEKYAEELSKPGRTEPLALQWKALSNEGGWTIDVPKDWEPEDQQ